MSFLSVFTSSVAPPAAGDDRLSMPTRWLWIVALASLAWRGWMAAVVPLTGDEALFYWWARFLDYGYYDHPPMVAWWIAGMRAALGDAEWAIRMPAVLLPLGVGWALWWAWSPVSRERAAWAVLLYWLAPVNWLNALIATDSPVILWAAWATAALVRAEQAADRGRSPWGLYALSGVFMGLAFLSKYFAVLLGMAFVVYFALFARARWRALVLIVLAALPAVAVNLLWNLQHCWTNIMFNLFNRNEGAEASPANVMVYLVMMAYLISPVLLWLGWRHRSAWRTGLKGQALLVCAALVPLALFGLLAVKKEIGLHWVMGFYPFIFVLWVWALPASALRTAARGLGVFLVVHLLVAGGAALSDLSEWQRMKPHVRLVEKNYHRFVEAARAKEMVKQVQVPGVVLASNAYSAASIFGYAAGHHVPVLGRGSLHARQDDLIVDYAALDGQTIRVMATRNLSLDDYRGFFDSVRLLTFQQDGATFYVLEGVNFSYAAYRQQVMAEVNRRYYAFPSWLPVWSCSFCQRYCGANRCAP